MFYLTLYYDARKHKIKIHRWSQVMSAMSFITSCLQLECKYTKLYKGQFLSQLSISLVTLLNHLFIIRQKDQQDA